MDKLKVVRALSEIYTSVYYVDVLNDTFVEVHSLFEARDHIGETGHAQDRLNYFARNKGSEPQLLLANSHCGNDGERICRRRARGKTVGMNEHVAKPLDLNTLAKVLKTYLQ